MLPINDFRKSPSFFEKSTDPKPTLVLTPASPRSKATLEVDDYGLTFRRKGGHMIKFHEGAFHTVLGSYSLMPNDSSDDYKTLPRTQRYSALPPASYGRTCLWH